MNRRTLLLSGGAALVAVGAYGGMTLLTGGGSVLDATLIDPANAQTAPSEAIDTSRVVEMELGNAASAVTIIEYSSFTCPHCARFNQAVYPALKAAYIDTNLVRYIKREVYFDAPGLWAGLVARCGGPMRYFGIAEILYAEQDQWAHNADTSVVADNLRRIGRRAGMNDDTLNACLTDREMATAMMEVYRTGALEFDIRGTPSFVINGTTHSNLSFAEFQAILDPLLGR